MDILLLTTHINIGGVGVYVTTLASALKKRGHAVRVMSSGGSLAECLKEEGIQHNDIDIDTKSELSPKVFKAIHRLKEDFKKDRPDIIHSHTRITQVMSFFLSKGLNIPYVTTCHGFFRPHFTRRIFGCWGDLTIAISDAVKDHLVKDFKVDKQNVKVVYNGIDIEKFSQGYSDAQKDETKKALGLAKDDLVIGIIARLSDVKGHAYLIEAVNIILKKGLDVKLLIVGDGPMKERLVALGSKLSISDKLIFKDSYLNTRIPLSVMDVFVMPSVQEGLGLAILEAAGMARPIVATDVGGISAIVKNKITGLLVPPKDPNSLADTLFVLLKDETLRKDLGKNAQEFVIKNFSLETMSKNIEEVYQQAIAKRIDNDRL